MKFTHATFAVLAASIAVLAMLGSAVHAGMAFIDDFDDNSIGDVWNESSSGTGASLSETNGRLEFHFDADSREGPTPPGAPFGDVSAGVSHECKLTGDFDVRVDFDLTEWPEENGVRGGIILGGGVVTMQRDWDAIFDNVYTGGFMGTAFRTPTTDTSGTFRITREDSTVTASFANGGGWQTAASGVANEDPMSLTLRQWTHDHLLDARPEESKLKDITVTLDNLNLEKGNLACGEVDGVEFTQAIQELQTIDELMDDLEDDGKPPVPLIAGKPAAMRVYFDEVNQQEIRTVQISGEFSKTETVTLIPGCDPEERRKQEGGCKSVDFYFTPPDGEFEVTMNVFDFEGLREHYDFELTSVETDGLILKAVSVCDAQTPGGPFGLLNQWECGNAARLLSAASLLRRMYPTDSVAVALTGNRVTRDLAQFAQPIKWWGRVDRDLQAMYGIGDSLSAVLGTEVYYFGMARNAVPGGVLGAAYINTRGAASKENYIGLGYEAIPWVIAHETGHAMGLEHTNTAQPPLSGSKGCWLGTTSNLAWPWADNKLRSGPANDDVEVGFDVANRKALSGDDYYDFSGYCSSPPPAGVSDATVWISPFNFNRLLAPTGPLSVSSAPSNMAPSSDPTDYWLVGGTIDQDQAEFDPLVTLELGGLQSPTTGTHRLEVRDSGSGVLYTRMFTPAHGHGSPSPGDSVLNTLPSFSELVPVQDGAATIEVFDAFNTPIGQVDFGGEAPVVTIEEPPTVSGASNTLSVSWSIEDPDSDEHTYWVDYSADGGETWVSQGIALADTGIGLAPSALAGSDNAVVRVIASDGVNSGMAVSVPFSVAKKLPQGEIIGSTLNVFRVGELVWLEAAAWDVDDGTLDDGAVTWSSSIDGMLGTGASLPVYDLSEGQHTITMKAEDSDGNEVFDSVVVTVYDAPLLEGEVAIKGDLDCDDDVDSVDALKGLQHNAGLPVQLPDGCPPIGSGGAGAVAGDIDCDDDADSVDSLSILRHVAGLGANLPPGCKPIGV